MNNFSFLNDKPEYRNFSKDCVDAEAAFKNSYDSCVKLVRVAVDAAIKWVYATDKKISGASDNLYDLIVNPTFERAIGKNLADKLHYCRKAGNEAIHNEKEFSADEAAQCLKNLFDFVQWIDSRYGKNFTPRKFHGLTNKDDLLQTELLGMKLSTPIFAASGTFGFGEEFENFVDLKRLGGGMVKCTTRKPRRGNDGVRITETPAGMLNAIGLENPGVETFLTKILPRIKNKMNVVVNISGSGVEEYGELARLLDVDGVAAIELNISCPNVKDGGIIFGTDERQAAFVTSTAKKFTSKPVIVKLSPNVTDITKIARACESAGADCLSLINTLMGMEINIHTWRPTLGNKTGGLSGGAVKPVAVRMVWQVANAVKIPVIGMGGIRSAEDAAEFFLAGASAVAVGTANFAEPSITMKIADDLSNYLRGCGLKNIRELIGKVKA
ncbi:MAG: dihydroorotate dehydrogenase [Selenomonadaceae bacterium]|nr:dihydroorotate dehydrogenase [Selenomonadaceae bacterium]